MREKFTDKSVEEFRKQITRRGFLSDVLGYSAGLVFGGAMVKTARTVKDYNTKTIDQYLI
jgi:hypothetical protein